MHVHLVGEEQKERKRSRLPAKHRAYVACTHDPEITTSSKSGVGHLTDGATQALLKLLLILNLKILPLATSVTLNTVMCL